MTEEDEKVKKVIFRDAGRDKIAFGIVSHIDNHFVKVVDDKNNTILINKNNVILIKDGNYK